MATYDYDVLICRPERAPNGNALRVEARSHDEAATIRAAGIADTDLNDHVVGWPMLVIGPDTSHEVHDVVIDGARLMDGVWYRLTRIDDHFTAEREEPQPL